MDWEQAKAILWLRWRLAANQMRRRGRLGAAISLLGTTATAVLAVAALIGGFSIGAFELSRSSPQVLLWSWDILSLLFLFFWLIGLLSELQRSETIDLPRLMHLPVSLRQAFLFNYLASHLSLSILIAVPGALGIIAGLFFYRSPLMALLMFPAGGLLLAVTAWSYCLRGWLSSLMMNQRRRRGILAGATIVIVLLVQTPNLVMNVWLRSQVTGHNHAAILSPGAIKAHEFAPPLWPGYAAMHLARGNAWPALIFGAVTLLLAGLGLLRAYRSTISLYQGKASGKPVAGSPKPAISPASGGSRFLERGIPFIPDEAAAIALASFRSMTRATEIKMALASSLVMLLVFGSALFSQGHMKVPRNIAPFLTNTLITLPFLTALQLFNNQFGYDRDGFRLLLLIPAAPRNILFGRNLSLLPIVLLIGLLPLAIQGILLHASCAELVSTVLQLGGIFFLLCMIGNFFSIKLPYRINPGTVRTNKVPTSVSLAAFGGAILFATLASPLLMVPAFLETYCHHARWLRHVPLNPVFSLGLTVLLGLCYRSSLGSLAPLFEHRGKSILQAVTRENE